LIPERLIEDISAAPHRQPTHRRVCVADDMFGSVADDLFVPGRTPSPGNAELESFADHSRRRVGSVTHSSRLPIESEPVGDAKFFLSRAAIFPPCNSATLSSGASQRESHRSFEDQAKLKGTLLNTKYPHVSELLGQRNPRFVFPRSRIALISTSSESVTTRLMCSAVSRSSQFSVMAASCTLATNFSSPSPYESLFPLSAGYTETWVGRPPQIA
jgi:hypothetical protein